MNSTTTAAYVKQPLSRLKSSQHFAPGRRRNKSTNHLCIFRPLLTLEKYTFHLSTLRASLQRPRQLHTTRPKTSARPTDPQNPRGRKRGGPPYRGITPNICGYTCGLSGIPSKGVPEHTVVGRAFCGLAGATSVHQGVVHAVLGALATASTDAQVRTRTS